MRYAVLGYCASLTVAVALAVHFVKIIQLDGPQFFPSTNRTHHFGCINGTTIMVVISGSIQTQADEYSTV